MTGAPTTSPTLPICAVRFAGSACERQKLLPRISCAGIAAAQTISRLTRTAQAALRSSRGARSDRVRRRACAEAATGAQGTVRARMTWQGRRLHLVGIGGAGMSGYALVCAQLGATVSGSDRANSPVLERLRAAGIDARAGHDAANVPDGADVVLSSAIAPDNPERVAALDRGLNVLSRADLLAELTALKKVIAVAGAHGKTTTTSMAAHVLLGCGLDPGYLIGGSLTTTGTNAAWGTGEWLVVEAHEAGRSVVRLPVDVRALPNGGPDHPPAPPALAGPRDAYRAFLAGAPEAVIWDRPDLLALRDGAVVPYEPRDVSLTDGGSRFAWRGQDVVLRVPGLHNARNATAALEAAALAGADPAAAAGAPAGAARAGGGGGAGGAGPPPRRRAGGRPPPPPPPAPAPPRRPPPPP